MEAIIALSTSGFIEKYGAYAGLAAIPGLAVLSLLYFAQAREVRRLREWAGRAPEAGWSVRPRSRGPPPTPGGGGSFPAAATAAAGEPKAASGRVEPGDDQAEGAPAAKPPPASPEVKPADGAAPAPAVAPL